MLHPVQMLSDNLVTRAPVTGCSPRQDFNRGVLKSSDVKWTFNTVPSQSTEHRLQPTELPLLLPCNCLILSSASFYKLHDSCCKRDSFLLIAERVTSLGACGSARAG